MNKNTIDDAIRILLAIGEGKTIQWYDNGRWINRLEVNGSLPNFMQSTYRIKIEPKRIWVNLYKDSNKYNCAHETLSDANNAKYGAGECETIEFIQVLK